MTHIKKVFKSDPNFRWIQRIPQLFAAIKKLEAAVATSTNVVNIINIDLKETGNTNEYIVEITWIDADGVAQTTIDGTPINIDLSSKADISALNQEILARQNADTQLQNNINAEATARASEDTQILSDLNQEILDRQNADTQIQNNLNAESSTRQQNDTQLQTNIDNEATNRAQADTQLQSDIDNETIARQQGDNQLQINIDQEATARQQEDANQQLEIDQNTSDIQDLDTDVAALANSKRAITAQKNSIVDDNGDLQLENDALAPGPNMVYGTTPIGTKGWIQIPDTGDQTFINQSYLFKAYSGPQTNINQLSETTIAYKTAQAQDYSTSVFTPITNGVQLLTDLENVTVHAGVYAEDNNGQRVSVLASIVIDGVRSTIEYASYSRRFSGTNEDTPLAVETYPFLPAGTVITASTIRTGVASNNTNGIEDKAMFSVFGFVPSNAATLSGFPAPIITSITTI